MGRALEFHELVVFGATRSELGNDDVFYHLAVKYRSHKRG